MFLDNLVTPLKPSTETDLPCRPQKKGEKKKGRKFNICHGNGNPTPPLLLPACSSFTLITTVIIAEPRGAAKGKYTGGTWEQPDMMGHLHSSLIQHRLPLFPANPLYSGAHVRPRFTASTLRTKLGLRRDEASAQRET